MTYRCVPSPFPLAVLAEATRMVPNRRRSSDGICGDAAHLASGGDHVADARGIPHAVDISQSTPGSPYWDTRYGVFDAHDHGWDIGRRMLAGTETRVKYLVSFDGTKDVILDPVVSREWRQNGSFKTDHANHLHVSFTVGAEQSTAPFFLGDEPVTPADAKLFVDALLADSRFKGIVQTAAEDAIADKFSSYDGQTKKPNGLIILAREKFGVAPRGG